MEINFYKDCTAVHSTQYIIFFQVKKMKDFLQTIGANNVQVNIFGTFEVATTEIILDKIKS